MRWPTIALTFAILLFVSAAIYCGFFANRTQPVSLPPDDPPVSAAEAMELAAQFQIAIAAEDLEGMKNLIDYDPILAKAMANVSATDSKRAIFVDEMLSPPAADEQLVATILQSAEISSGGNLRLVRVHEHGGTQMALFRAITSVGGINYYDWEVRRRKNGHVAFTDMFDFYSGGTVSQRLRDLFLDDLAEYPATFSGKLGRALRGEPDHIKFADEISDIYTFARSEPAKTLAAYEKLPDTLKNLRELRAWRLVAAQKLGGEAYIRVMEEFGQVYGDDPATNLVMIDYYVLRQKYAEAIGAIDKLDAYVGGDAALNILRAGVHLESGDLSAARQAANRAIAGVSRSCAWLLEVGPDFGA